MARRNRGPIWGEPAPGSRKPRLSREQIAGAALAIADAEGFEAVSMRRIADELDVGTMTLYHYVRTKDDLVTLMDDALMGEVLIPPGALPTEWRAGLTAIARATRDVFVRHPWALTSMSGTHIGPNILHHMEQSMAVVSKLPLDDHGKLELVAIVDDFVFGHVLRIADTPGGGLDARAARNFSNFTTTQLATGAFPTLELLLGDGDPVESFYRLGKWMSDERRFERGLEALLDGLEARFLRKPPRKR